MQKRQVVLYFLVPADQHASEAIHPTMRAFHDPPSGLETSILLERLGLFPPRPEVGGEPTLGQQVADLVIDGRTLEPPVTPWSNPDPDADMGTAHLLR